MSSTRPPMFAGPIERQTNDFRIGSSDWLIGGGSGGVCGGPCATSARPAMTHAGMPIHPSARTRRISRVTGVNSFNLFAEVYFWRLAGFRRHVPVGMFLEAEHLGGHV